MLGSKGRGLGLGITEKAGSVSGIKEIDRALSKLERRINKKVMKGRMYFGRKSGRNGWHAHLVESGTGERIVNDKWGLKKRGYRQRARKMNVGRMKAQHMAKEGFDITTPKAKRIFQRALARELQKIRSVN